MDKQKSFEIIPSDKPKKERKPWNVYFMDMARIVAQRSTCDRANVGCVLVNENHRVLSTGYNGSVGQNTQHCDDIGHTMRDGHCIATAHAEINAITMCCKEGISTDGATCYVTHYPCLNCTIALIQAGIKKVYYMNGYRVDDYAEYLFKVNNIETEKVKI